MDEDKIKALAREYAEELHASTSEPFKDDIICEEVENAESFLRFLLRRYCLVEKSRLAKLDIAYRAKEYDMVILNKEDVDYLFPEIAKEVSHE